ncbi:DUF4249 domain-containing protein [Pararhodonellum marinum]|uniref:DUF4249 domain-containing protein n=1 Tax=Pararhodonellum marinum TaxID=2755358 RepID=UPI00188E7186|nr:DUF4249 domain-containing protein [Pararhodonellum marinum]
MKRTVYFLWFAAFTFFSCEQFLEIELGDQEIKMVMYSSLTPGDTIKVYLSESQSILADRREMTLIKNATVYLADRSGHTISLEYMERSHPFQEEHGYYWTTDFDIQENEEIKLTAEHPLYPSVESFVTIPEKVMITEVEAIPMGSVQNFGENEMVEFRIEFDDLPGNNYYVINGYATGTYWYYTSDTDSAQAFYNMELYLDPINSAFKPEFMYRSGLFINDALLPDGQVTIVAKANLPKNIDFNIDIELAHVSESYFNYFLTGDLQLSTGGDPLAQPVQVYNNINNGFGVFKAKNPDVFTLEVFIKE